MEMNNIINARSRREFREWLLANHATERECWVSVKRGRPVDDGTFWYIDAVEEAMCFGWIDATTKRLPSGITVQRFCPRRKKSQWSEQNKARCRRMERLGLMTGTGREVLPDLSEEGFHIDGDILHALQADRRVWENFLSLPPLYRRVRIDTIQIKRKDERLFRQRLEKFIENTHRGILYGEWNDNGRLADDE
ncbi:MAG: YdeI/OmpD-associated family protein [Bacteroidales bacterium]|nr:YdeI/OmpD-associated family protein [Bacteroidales bacterium]MCM1148281.1 YdeI/OmpD-associated family protein [Bacteroidales bacterium]MCM1206485.1 YdeI/OmpD-associated family protein [Bacillota bacterium]MCM1510371.1 YdeI/OmpD-associated family protein [Clostridium sp.]